VTCARARFAANFNRLGFDPGFGLSLTLPNATASSKNGNAGRRISAKA
jgi:hypothetical protein